MLVVFFKNNEIHITCLVAQEVTVHLASINNMTIEVLFFVIPIDNSFSHLKT
jgi:hypothetical protein